MSEFKGVWPHLTLSKVGSWTKNWSRSGAVFALAAGLAVPYFTDWKAVLQYVPFINTKWSSK